MGYERGPVLGSLEIPMLAVFGEQDRIVPVEKSIEAMKTAFASSGHESLLTVLVIPGDHFLRVATSADQRELPSGVIESVIEWVIGSQPSISGSTPPPSAPRRR